MQVNLKLGVTLKAIVQGRIAASRGRSGLRSPVAYLLVLPALLIFLVFAIGPTVFTFVVSTFKWNWLNPDQNKFVGLANYQMLVDGSHDPPFAATLLTSGYFVGAMVVGGTAISPGLAMPLRQASRINMPPAPPPFWHM